MVAFQDSQHSRAQANLIYYQRVLNDDLQTKNKEYKNERPVSTYPEREVYEALCRGEIPNVNLF